MAAHPPRLYFAYGSSLSLSEMQSHCPTSTFYSIAILRNHRWFVNERGYANVVPSTPVPKGNEDIVWGIIYTIRAFDEELLDKHEGLPWAYSKEDMDVEAISITNDGRGTRREVVRALVYIDRQRVQESYPWPEFVVKMNKGIQEAVERGIPRMWINSVVRSYIQDPATANGTETQAGGNSVPPTPNGFNPPSITRLESDRASHTQGSVVGERPVNGASQNGSSNPISQALGLEKSKYAQQSMTRGASPRRASKERNVVAEQNRLAASNTPAHMNKQQECWWWKVKGSCRFSDNNCQHAHFITGVVADPPGRKNKGNAAEQRSSFGPPKSIPKGSKQGKSGPPNATADKRNNANPYGYPQDWSGQQGITEEPKTEEQKTKEPNPETETEEPKASWSDQVENLMDSQPEWLVSNDRTDVKW
jgi:gamma-glutamylcyclotransferase